MKKNEKRKSMLISELEDFKRQKIQMEEYLKRGKEEDAKRESIKKENEKIAREMNEIREATIKAIAKIKGIEGEKKGIEEQMVKNYTFIIIIEKSFYIISHFQYINISFIF
jgi:hypothetical protein